MADSRNLAADCIRILSEEQQADKGTNRALYPTVVLFFGEQEPSCVQTVEETLRGNWANARYVKYLHVKKTEQGWQAALRGGKKAKEAEEYQELDALLERSVVEMLGTEEYIFRSKQRIKYEFVWNGQEEEAESYFQFVCSLSQIHSSAALKTSYVMLDESSREKKRKCRRFLKFLSENWEETKQEAGTVYLLSNYLRDGSMLLGERLELNYRLVADIILLGGNDSADSNMVSSAVYNYATIKTASYAIVEKPIKTIAVLSLHKMLDTILEYVKRSYQEKEQKGLAFLDTLKKKMGILPNETRAVEEIFHQYLEGKLPNAKELAYLPFVSEREMKEFKKEKQVSLIGLNNRTAGTWNLFFQKYYFNPVTRRLQEPDFLEKCKNQFEQDWKTHLDYFEILYGFTGQTKTDILEEIRPAVVSKTADSAEESVHRQAVERVKHEFYDSMKKTAEEVMEAMHEKAEIFYERYETLTREIAEMDIDNQEHMENIRTYYETMVQHYVEQEGAALISEIFRQEHSDDRLFELLKEMFQRMVKANPVYGYSFEKEMEERLSEATPAQRMLTVRTELERNIEEYGRLNWFYTYTNHIRGTYYLINKQAAYARELNEGNGNTLLFHLNRKDCIEKIAIFDIPAVDMLEDAVSE